MKVHFDAELKSVRSADDGDKLENDIHTTRSSQEVVEGKSAFQIDTADMAKTKEVHAEKESQQVISDIQEEEKPKNRRSRRRV